MTERGDFATKRVGCGPEAETFVHGELETAAADGFEGPLAQRLLARALGPPFTYLPPSLTAEPLPPCHRGGHLPEDIDRTVAQEITRWLRSESPDRQRVLVMEESLGRRGDPAWQRAEWAKFFFGERVYAYATSEADADEVFATLRRVSSYPGIGVLTETHLQWASDAVLTERDLDGLVDLASAVVVCAWDGEAHVLAPTWRSEP